MGEKVNRVGKDRRCRQFRNAGSRGLSQNNHLFERYIQTILLPIVYATKAPVFCQNIRGVAFALHLFKHQNTALFLPQGTNYTEAV